MICLTDEQVDIVTEALDHTNYLLGCFDDICDHDVKLIQNAIDTIKEAEERHRA